MDEVLAACGDSARQAAVDSPLLTGVKCTHSGRPPLRFRRAPLWPPGEEPPRPVAEYARLWHKIKSSAFYMCEQAPGSAAPVEGAKGVPHGRILRAQVQTQAAPGTTGLVESPCRRPCSKSEESSRGNLLPKVLPLAHLYFAARQSPQRL
jgi:hypothetical protein